MFTRKALFQTALLLSWTTLVPLLGMHQQAVTAEITNTARAEQKTDLANVKALDTRLILKLRERHVYLYQGDRLLASYPVAVGKKGWETPTGNFKVIQMIENPVWEHPWNGSIVLSGPNNPLGERWIAFWTDGKNYIGFHGTPAEQLIGQAVSHGCIRMRNKDVKALFEKVTLGTPVIVEP